MRISTPILLSLLCITAIAPVGSGCGTPGSGDEDVTVETGDTGEPEDPLDPTPTEAPLLSNALWSLRWQVGDSIPSIDHGPLGLGLATTERCALIDAETGALVWSVTAPMPAEASVLRMVGDELVWALRGPSGGWTLNHYDGSGEDPGVVALEGSGALAIDANGVVFIEGSGEIAAFSPDGSPAWTHDLSADHLLVQLDGLDGPQGGVVVLEVGDQLDEDGLVEFRLGRLDAGGDPVASVDFVTTLLLIDDLAVVEDRVYAAAAGALGLPGAVLAAEFGTGLAWSVEFGTKVHVTVEAGAGAGAGAGAYMVHDAAVEQPATLLSIDPDGATHELGPVTSHPVSDRVVLELGANGELFAGARADGVVELHRLE